MAKATRPQPPAVVSIAEGHQGAGDMLEAFIQASPLAIIRGEEIPLGARILAVVDAYSAITDHRPYKAALTHTEAVAELRRCAATQFDSRVVEIFCRIVEPSA